MHGDTIRGPHVDARAHTTRANSTPQRSGARAVQQPQRDGMADSKFEVHAIVGERLYRFMRCAVGTGFSIPLEPCWAATGVPGHKYGDLQKKTSQPNFRSISHNPDAYLSANNLLTG